MANAIGFFSGAGGLDMGIEQAGFDLKLSVELIPTYSETLRLNHANLVVHDGDIMDMSKDDVYNYAGLDNYEEVDIIVGGSPCQSFSTAGKRQAFSDVRGNAMLKYADLIADIKPKAFILENVRGLLSASLRHRPLNERGGENPPLSKEEERGSALEHVLSYFKDYTISYELLNAADYGTPQTRQRVFIVGIRKDINKEFQFPEKTHGKVGLESSEGLLPWVSFEEATAHLATVEHTYQTYSADRMRYMLLIPRGGGNWRDLRQFGVEITQKAMGGAYHSGGGKVGFYRRLYADRPAPTLLTSPTQKSTNLGHPFENRPLSIEEYKAIQQFPDDYELNGT